MRGHEPQFDTPESFSRPEGTARDRYGPDWARDIGEPMVCRYLETHFPSFQKVHWVQDVPRSMQLDRAGVDGIVRMNVAEGGESRFLGIQFSTASLTEARGREVWLKKFQAWKRNPVLKVNGEAEYIGAREGDSLPVVFVHVPHADLENAWERTPHGDWRTDDARDAAREAATNLPQTPRFQKGIVDSMWLSLETLSQERGEFAGVLDPQRNGILEERKRIEESMRPQQS